MLNYFIIVIKVCVYKSQLIIYPSNEPLKSIVSLLLNARHVTQSSWPFKLAIIVFV